MELPEINYEDLPEEIKDRVKEGEFSFEKLSDLNYFVDFKIDWETISGSKQSYAKRLIAQRKYVEDLKRITKQCDSGKITEEDAVEMAREARRLRDENV